MNISFFNKIVTFCKSQNAVFWIFLAGVLIASVPPYVIYRDFPYMVLCIMGIYAEISKNKRRMFYYFFGWAGYFFIGGINYLVCNPSYSKAVIVLNVLIVLWCTLCAYIWINRDSNE